MSAKVTYGYRNGNKVHINDAERFSNEYIDSRGKSLVVKKGETKTHHFAYKHENDADPWQRGKMTEWHRKWQDMCYKECVEVRMGKPVEHIADIKTPKGLVVELQHSSISADDIREREAFYGKMVWLWDYSKRQTCFYEADFTAPPHFRSSQPLFSIQLSRNDPRLTVAERPCFVDMGNNRIMQLVLRDGYSALARNLSYNQFAKWYMDAAVREVPDWCGKLPSEREMSLNMLTKDCLFINSYDHDDHENEVWPYHFQQWHGFVLRVYEDLVGACKWCTAAIHPKQTECKRCNTCPRCDKPCKHEEIIDEMCLRCYEEKKRETERRVAQAFALEGRRKQQQEALEERQRNEAKEKSKTWLNLLAAAHVASKTKHVSSPETCVCGGRKRPQFDKCYGCFTGNNKENHVPVASSAPPVDLMPPPAPKAPLTQQEKEFQRLERWYGDQAWGPRVNTPFLVRYWRVVRIGAKPADEELLAIINKHQHLYSFDSNGLLKRRGN